MDQEVKKPISQKEFVELRRKFKKKLKRFQNLGNNIGVSPPPANNNNPPNSANMATSLKEQRFPYRPIKIRLIPIHTCKNLTMFFLPIKKTQMQPNYNYFMSP